ncbi:hypothetical protein F7725_002884 [Dissostichus mawsoni]|uniref:Uncharacterized protein n=1 Tax=Dissostichus mawsoni TaxID=36200 RepID=A0A7J5Y8L7_DISMA|nr:hypothetical protein F7725_002884 [Dissostichus mawsoni]
MPDADGLRIQGAVLCCKNLSCLLQVKKLTRYLDPNAHGKINFKDFCHGVLAIKGCEGILKMAVGPRSVASTQPSVTDNGYIYQVHC